MRATRARMDTTNVQRVHTRRDCAGEDGDADGSDDLAQRLEAAEEADHPGR